MSDHNNAIRMAQNLLRNQADLYKDVEVGYHQHAPNPLARGYRAAANEIAALLIPEENITRPTAVTEAAMCGETLRTENYVHECVEDEGHTGKHKSITGIWWMHTDRKA